jgi:hypothetical protein
MDHSVAPVPESQEARIPGVHGQIISSLDDLVTTARHVPNLYVRWSADPQDDMRANRSRDGLTGTPLPGLSASPLAAEPWWKDRSPRLWLARRLYDYSHLEHLRPPGTHPWVFSGHEVGRGPDNEPLVHGHRFIAHITDEVIAEAEDEIAAQDADAWGPLNREG